MIAIELFPTAICCIERTARSVYNDLVSQYLSGNSNLKDLEDKIELLTSFLQTADFKKLRRESEPYLLQDRRVIFTIYDDGTEIRYSMKIH